MTTLNRREFLDRTKQTGLGLAAGVTILRSAASVYGAPANEKIILALVGCGGRGTNLSSDFARRGDCRFAYACDVDSNRLAPVAKALAAIENGSPPQQGEGFRQKLGDKKGG